MLGDIRYGIGYRPEIFSRRNYFSFSRIIKRKDEEVKCLKFEFCVHFREILIRIWKLMLG